MVQKDESDRHSVSAFGSYAEADSDHGKGESTANGADKQERYAAISIDKENDGGAPDDQGKEIDGRQDQGHSFTESKRLGEDDGEVVDDLSRFSVKSLGNGDEQRK